MNNIIYFKMTNFNYKQISYNVQNNIVFDLSYPPENWGEKVSSNFRFFVWFPTYLELDKHQQVIGSSWRWKGFVNAD